jgi:polysaccharide deacetylase 2 family uncharacterized protein YibQ
VAADDDLNAPLGQEKPKSKLPKLPFGAPQLLAGLLGLFGLVAVGWAVFGNDPLGGEPIAVVATAPAPQGKTAVDALGGDGMQHARHDGSAGSAPNADAAATAKPAAHPVLPPGAKTVTIIDGSSGKREDVVIPGNASPKPPVDKRLLEVTPQGPIPQVAADGTRALALYARPRKLPADRSNAPRIAVIVGGLGISAGGTADALARLPAPVTLAFAPYGANLEALAESARAQNHEVLLQVPMEPFDYPSNDPGPRTLLTTLSPAQNIDRLHWLMARFQGYVGLIGYMGAKFTASAPALTPVLKEAAKRGLIYVDDSSSPRSAAAEIAGGHNMPFAKADIVLDAVPTPQQVNHALERLEMAARDHGFAVGFASAQPAAVAAIAAWAKKVEAKGFVLVPISMVAVKAKST